MAGWRETEKTSNEQLTYFGDDELAPLEEVCDAWWEKLSLVAKMTVLSYVGAGQHVARREEREEQEN